MTESNRAQAILSEFVSLMTLDPNERWKRARKEIEIEVIDISDSDDEMAPGSAESCKRK